MRYSLTINFLQKKTLEGHTEEISGGKILEIMLSVISRRIFEKSWISFRKNLVKFPSGIFGDIVGVSGAISQEILRCTT